MKENKKGRKMSLINISRKQLTEISGCSISKRVFKIKLIGNYFIAKVTSTLPK